jgi:hypothetical protein
MNEFESRITASMHEAGDGADLPESDLADVFVRTRRRSVTRRVLGAAVILLVVLAAGGFVVAGRSDSSHRPIKTGGNPSTVVPNVSAARPVLDGCKANAASEAVVVGGSANPEVDRPIPEEVFADPSRGLSGPLVAFQRGTGALLRTGDGVAGGGKTVNGQVNGRDADIEFYGNHGGMVWDASSGGGSILYESGLSEGEMRAVAEQLDAGTTDFPQGLVSLGMTETATVSTSTCYNEQGQSASITEIRGDKASRYREAFDAAPGTVRRFDQGDATIVIYTGTSGGFDIANATYHEATPEEWRQICTSVGSHCGKAPPSTTTP